MKRSSELIKIPRRGVGGFGLEEDAALVVQALAEGANIVFAEEWEGVADLDEPEVDPVNAV